MKQEIRAIEIIPRKFKIERPGPGGDLACFIDGQRLLTMHYVYPYTDNAGQYRFMENFARGNMNECDTLEIDGQDKTNI
jgi:hypothetical protein